MKKEKKVFATFWTPGIIVAESRTREVATPDPMAVKWPDYAYAFQLSEREDVIDGNKTYTGESKNVGPLYYHSDSKVETLAQVKMNPSAPHTLIRNMERNKWSKIVWSRWGNWPQPFDEKTDQVLPTLTRFGHSQMEQGKC